MPQLTPQEFVDRWSKSELKKTTGSQSHFNDVCALVDQPQPIVADPKGELERM